MFGFFTPRYVLHARELLRAVRKLLHYRRDLLPGPAVEAVETEAARLEKALRGRHRKDAEAASEALERMASAHFPPPSHAGLRENCEVMLVAVVIAVGVRTFFLQPFTIPTGSMQPTLNGILSTVTNQPAPSWVQRTLEFALWGRSYVDVVSAEDDVVESLRETTRMRFFTYTEVQCKKQHFLIHAPAQQLRFDFDIKPGRVLKAGEALAQGYIDTGDHVFVDKVSYHFRRPQNGEVFVFNTTGIPTRENQLNPGAPSQYYIKRLAGLPGDTLRIAPPLLWLNTAPATQFAFERVAACKDGYHGYSNAPAGGGHFRYLGSPDATLRLPPKSYFALGDNSFHSSDSRDWGVVPEQNLMGRGLFVYWPFTKHWGLIK